MMSYDDHLAALYSGMPCKSSVCTYQVRPRILPEGGEAGGDAEVKINFGRPKRQAISATVPCLRSVPVIMGSLCGENTGGPRP